MQKPGAVFFRYLLHTLLHNRFCFLPGNLSPVPALCLKLSGEKLHGPVKDDSQIHRPHFKELPLPKSQAIGRKMGKSTGGKLLQTGDTVFQNLPVKDF